MSKFDDKFLRSQIIFRHCKNILRNKLIIKIIQISKLIIFRHFFVINAFTLFFSSLLNNFRKLLLILFEIYYYQNIVKSFLLLKFLNINIFKKKVVVTIKYFLLYNVLVSERRKLF